MYNIGQKGLFILETLWHCAASMPVSLLIGHLQKIQALLSQSGTSLFVQGYYRQCSRGMTILFLTLGRLIDLNEGYVSMWIYTN